MPARIIRRYIGTTRAEELRLRQHPGLKVAAFGAESFNIMSGDVTEWHVVPDDDPRVDTIDKAEHEP